MSGNEIVQKVWNYCVMTIQHKVVGFNEFYLLFQNRAVISQMPSGKSVR